MSKRKKRRVKSTAGRQIKKRAKRFVKTRVVNFIATFLYILGLSLAIPLWTYVFYPSWVLSVKFVATIVLSFSLIVGSKWLLEEFYRKKRDAYRQLAFATIIPVILAIVLSLFSVEFFFAVIKAFVPQADLVQPIVEDYLARKVPRVLSVLVFYALVGGFWLRKVYYSKR